MPATLAATLEQTILEHQIMPLACEWADEIVFPYYDGLSIRNLAHTIVRLLDDTPPANRLGTAPLDSRLWEHHRENTNRVVLFLTDGLGWRLLQQLMAEDAAIAQLVADLVGEGTLTPITSIAPSTTVAALPCIWTGASPAATGMVGTRLFLREYGVMTNMLHYFPTNGKHRREVLEAWGLDFETFLPPETLGEALSARQIPTHLLLQKDLLFTGLSRIMHRGIKHIRRHFGYTDLWIELRELLRATHDQRCFVTVYWSAIDSLSHLHGTVTEQVITEIRSQLITLRDLLAADGVRNGHTVFMLAADHGHTPVPDYVNINKHPPLAEALRCELGGDGRFAHVYLRHDFRQLVIDHINMHLSDKMAAVIPSEALQAGLFGPEDPHPETSVRLGDLTLIARQNVTISDRRLGPYATVSRHGGLSTSEMLVPLLITVL